MPSQMLLQKLIPEPASELVLEGGHLLAIAE